MAKSTTIKAAIASFEKAQSAEKGQTVVASKAEEVHTVLTVTITLAYRSHVESSSPALCVQVDLSAQVPPIEKLDAALGTLRACRCTALLCHFSASNCIPCRPSLARSDGRVHTCVLLLAPGSCICPQTTSSASRTLAT